MLAWNRSGGRGCTLRCWCDTNFEGIEWGFPASPVESKYLASQCLAESERQLYGDGGVVWMHDTIGATCYYPAAVLLLPMAICITKLVFVHRKFV